MEAQKDILCFLINILVICGIVRIYQLVSWIKEKPSTRKAYLQHSIHQLLFTIVDILIIPFLLIIFVFPWRISELRQYWKINQVLKDIFIL